MRFNSRTRSIPDSGQPFPPKKTLEDDGGLLVIRKARGDDESWLSPKWMLTHVRMHGPSNAKDR